MKANEAGSKGHILVIDDETIVRELAQMMLQRLGYTVSTAADGEAGINTYVHQQNQIDLVLVDMSMPDMDGMQCFKQLREINGNVKVILTTGFSREYLDAEAPHSPETSINGFLQKPFLMQDLSDLLASCLSEDLNTGLNTGLNEE